MYTAGSMAHIVTARRAQRLAGFSRREPAVEAATGASTAAFAWFLAPFAAAASVARSSSGTLCCLMVVKGGQLVSFELPLIRRHL